MAKFKSGKATRGTAEEWAAKRPRHPQTVEADEKYKPGPDEMYEAASGIKLQSAARALIRNQVRDLEAWSAVIAEGNGKSVYTLFQRYLDRVYDCG